jgi:VWFA-related protein
MALLSTGVRILPGQDRPSVRLKTELVIVDVVAEDEEGKLIGGLKKENFVLYEEKVAQEIVHFEYDQRPLSVVLVIDTSDSMRPVFGLAQKASQVIVSCLKPEDEIALFTTHARTQLIYDFGVDKHQLTEAISSLMWKRGGGIHVNDAVMVATQHVKTVASGRRRVTIMVTDDEPFPPNKYSKEAALHEALESDNIISCVQVTSKLHSVFRPMVWGIKTVGRLATVKTYADETGGSAVTISNEQEIAAKLQAFLDQFRFRYVLGYYPSNQSGEGLRRIKVELAKEAEKQYGKIRLRYRRGYVVARSSLINSI